MAQAPTPPPLDPTAGAGGNPMAGAADDTGDADADDDVVCTICKNGDGSYTVYAGDEPEEGGGDDMSEDDADAMGPAGGAAVPAGGGANGAGAMGGLSSQGIPADGIGAALKAALDILQSDASSAGAPGSSDDQFSAGFSASKAPTPATGRPAQKY